VFFQWLEYCEWVVSLGRQSRLVTINFRLFTFENSGPTHRSALLKQWRGCCPPPPPQGVHPALLKQKTFPFPYLICFSDRRGLGNLMFPLWFVFLGRSFVFLDMHPSNFYFVFRFFWVLWFIYGWQGFIKVIRSRIGFQSLSNVQLYFFQVYLMVLIHN